MSPDVSLHVHEEGAGEALVLLHGNGEDHTYFSAQIAHFSNRYRVLAVDTRGHGASPRGTAPFTLTQFSMDLERLLDERGIEKAVLLGFSDGGNIALLFALRRPERVAALILNGANLRPAGVKLHVQLPIVFAYGLLCCIAPLDQKAVPKRELLRLMVKEPHIRETELARLAVPTLVLVGDRDMIRDAHSRRIAAAIPGAEFVRLPGSHFIAAENSGAFNACVEGFLCRRP